MNFLKRITQNLSSAQTVVVYGLFAGLIYVVVIMISRVVALNHILHLRFLNFLVLFITTLICLLELKARHNNALPYIRGLFSAMLLGAASISVLAVYIFFYLKFFDHKLLEFLIKNAPFGWVLNPTSVAFWPAHELLGAQILYALIIMEYIKYLQVKAKMK